MNNHYQLYLKTYKTTRNEIVEKIKSTFLKGINKTTFNPCSKKVYGFLEKYVNSNLPHKRSLSNYYHILKFDIKEYIDDHRVLVFEEHLIPQLEADSHISLNIEDIIIEITKFIAYEDALKDYDELIGIYRMMYGLGRFDGYQEMPEFDLLDSYYSPNPLDHKIYQELKALSEGKSINEQRIGKRIKEESETFITIPKFHTKNTHNILLFNYFKFPEDIISKISNKGFFKALTNEIIDPDKTSYLDFIITIFINPKYHRSSITFKSENSLGCLFINELIFPTISKNFRKDFYNYGLLKSKKTENKDSTSISQSSFSKALKKDKRNYERNMEIVKRILIYHNSID